MLQNILPYYLVSAIGCIIFKPKVEHWWTRRQVLRLPLFVPEMNFMTCISLSLLVVVAPLPVVHRECILKLDFISPLLNRALSLGSIPHKKKL